MACIGTLQHPRPTRTPALPAASALAVAPARGQPRGGTKPLAIVLRVAGCLIGCLPWAALAAMPWEAPMCAVASSLKGQVAVMLAVVSTIMIGIMFMYSETGSAVSRIAGWLLGMCCALSVASVITALFPGVTLPGCL